MSHKITCRARKESRCSEAQHTDAVRQIRQSGYPSFLLPAVQTDGYQIAMTTMIRSEIEVGERRLGVGRGDPGGARTPSEFDHPERRNPQEVPPVVSDHRQVANERLCSDQRVHETDPHAPLLHVCAQCARRARVIAIEGDGLETSEKRAHGAASFHSPTLQAVLDLEDGHTRYADLIEAQSAHEPTQSEVVFTNRIGEGTRINQVAHRTRPRAAHCRAVARRAARARAGPLPTGAALRHMPLRRPSAARVCRHALPAPDESESGIRVRRDESAESGAQVDGSSRYVNALRSQASTFASLRVRSFVITERVICTYARQWGRLRQPTHMSSVADAPDQRRSAPHHVRIRLSAGKGHADWAALHRSLT